MDEMLDDIQKILLPDSSLIEEIVPVASMIPVNMAANY